MVMVGWEAPGVFRHSSWGVIQQDFENCKHGVMNHAR
jgi:hypothetical protein